MSHLLKLRTFLFWFLSFGVALTFAAVTLRLYLPVLGGTLGFETGYPIVAWLCWVPNLIVAEWILRRRARSVAGLQAT